MMGIEFLNRYMDIGIRYIDLLYILIIVVMLTSCADVRDKRPAGRAFYVHETGKDANEGSIRRPWRTIGRLNALNLKPGDTIFFQGGGTFEGTLQLDSADVGNESFPVVITSYGSGKASVHSGAQPGISMNRSKFVRLKDLHVVGSGRKQGNTGNGVEVKNSDHIEIDSIEVEGFQKSGLLIHTSSWIKVNQVHAHDNGAAGISVSGANGKAGSRNIHMTNCLAENNPGDPTNFTNHSGNGIVVGSCRNVIIEYCAATNNGWDMPRTGNGPVGIWAYEADSIIIQHCISYRNKTSKGGEDGGGFDLDGGVTNSIIQYCLSYENEGAGFGIFQYNGASTWKNNTVRFNISENDGLVSTAHAGIYVWNGSNYGDQFTDCFIYNNVIYNAHGTAVHFATESERKRFYYYNNIFVAQDELTKGRSVNDAFAGNNWWSLRSRFNINGVRDFETWTNQTGQEKIDGERKGHNIDPAFVNTDGKLITDPHALASFTKYTLPPGSLLRTKGLDLKAMFRIETGDKDLNQNPPPATGIGASF